MLEVRGVGSVRKGRRLLHPLSGHFPTGAITALIGPNGSGKSTLLKTLCGIWETTEGDVHWNGGALSSLSRKERSRLISYVPQSPTPTFPFSVGEVVAMGRYPHGVSDDDARIVEGALRAVGGWELRECRIDQISGGELQRVYFARAIVTQAPVILLDEPTANLDIRHQAEVWRLIERQARHGRTIVVATHDLTACRGHAEHALLLHHGVCTAWGERDQVLTDSALTSLFGSRPFSREDRSTEQEPASTEYVAPSAC